jgi:lipopolysaccharide transport protein LptA
MASSPSNSLSRACLSMLLACTAWTGLGTTVNAAALASDDAPTWDSKSLFLDGKTNLLVLLDFHLKTPKSGYAIDAGEARTNDANNFSNSRWTFTNKVTFTLPNGSITAETATVTFVNNQISALQVTGSPANFEHYDERNNLVARGTAGVMEYTLADNTVKLSNQAWVSTGQNECRAAAMVYNISEQRLSASSNEQQEKRPTCTVIPTDKQAGGKP